MKDSIFKLVLADDWDSLGDIIKEHYFLRPYSNDYICVCGEMTEIYHSFFAKFIIPFGLIFGAIVPYKGKNVPVDVHYNANTQNSNIYWDRVFKFSEKKYFHFKSHMVHVKDNNVIEFVRFGIGIKLKVTSEQGAIVFRDTGYIWRIFGKDIPLPLSLVLGHIYVEERPLDTNTFSMKMIMTHPWFGVLFRYKGVFNLNKDTAKGIERPQHINRKVNEITDMEK
ncbi:MAG: DUF4166 domain-containing protein [Cocleimonas sp.]